MCQNVYTRPLPLVTLGDTESTKRPVTVAVQRKAVWIGVSGLGHKFNDAAVAVELRLDASYSGERESSKFTYLYNDLIVLGHLLA